MKILEDDIKVLGTDTPEFSADKKSKKKDIKNERIRSRIWELDFLRGVCVILMLFDHLMYDIGYAFSEVWFDATGNFDFIRLMEFVDGYWNGTLRGVVRPLVVLCFFLLCGISCSFSRSNFKRGSILLGFSLLLSGVTIGIGMPIIFGVLHMLSVSILIIALVRLVTRKKTKETMCVNFVLGALFIIAGVLLDSGVVNFGYTNNYLCFLSKQFIDGSFVSLDYFPMLPNTGIVLIGASMAPILYPKKRTLFSRLDTQFRWYRPFNFCGRNAAIFYILHQVVWGLLLGLITIIAFPNGWQVLVDYFFSGV